MFTNLERSFSSNTDPSKINVEFGYNPNTLSSFFALSLPVNIVKYPLSNPPITKLITKKYNLQQIQEVFMDHQQ